MARYRFREGIKYGARLRSVVERPIENSPLSGLRLLRLEFEVFAADESRRTLSSNGDVACRDLVVGPAVDASKDSSLIAYAGPLGVRNRSDPSDWLCLNGQQRWLGIKFGAVEEADLRNVFQTISSFDPDGWSVREYRYELDQDWVTVAQAARDLRTSESSIRRRVHELEPVWGARLLWRTAGGHRRIRLSLLRNLWTE
jgi:hypothetical protein